MSDFQKLFQELDQESRKIATLKDLFAGLYMREGMEEIDKLRLAKTFLNEAREGLLEMDYLISQYRDRVYKAVAR